MERVHRGGEAGRGYEAVKHQGWHQTPEPKESRAGPCHERHRHEV